MTERLLGFAKVRIAPRTFRLIKITSETDDLITGMRVDSDGGRWERETPDATQTEMVVCHPREVVDRLALNLHYCELEPE